MTLTGLNWLVTHEHVHCKEFPERDESEENAALAEVLWFCDEADRDRCLMDSAKELARTQAMVPRRVGLGKNQRCVRMRGGNGEP